MKLLSKLNLIFCSFLLLIGTLGSCQPTEKANINHDSSYSEGNNDSDSSRKHKKKHKKRNRRENSDNENSKYGSENRSNDTQTDIRTGNAPEKALKVLKYVRENGVAIDGYVGGRKFGNYEGLLPKNDASGKRINYQEWDVNPKVNGKNRGTERLITGSDGKAYYTNDHYRSFVEVRN
ncbi:ribonuclease domain-containing protein [Arcicella sp. LKC2W]|uniref:ribonuclease domain-containing protein n=1 Tax=Arcicella sp. LKC2W TaxID=2984198 RepID=UPI002B1F5693|nr:ribonuclease domain-containing protein [Arcicella sp. LKC2W]MEA5458611.1 ribonuclease domain-containing protein [Arcicella sp. LKC2W]